MRLTVTGNGQSVKSGGGISIGGGSVSVGGAKASFYPAQEAYRGSSGTTTVNGVPVTGSDLGNGISATSFTIPAQKELGTVLWRDEASGLYCRIQSILDQETLLRMAESVK